MVSEEKQIEATKKILKEIKAETMTEFVKVSIDLERKPTIFESKFGGVPYIAKDEKVPVDSKGEQLRLLAQINFGDISEITPEYFPKKGFIQFWVLDEDLIGLDFDEPTKQDTFKVVYKEYVDKTVSKDDVLAKFNDSEDDEESFFPVEGEFALKFEKKNAPMYSWSYVFGELFAKKFNAMFPEEEKIDSQYDLDIEIEDIDGIEEFEGSDDSNHQIGGYPSFAQEDPRDGFAEFEDYDTLLFQMDSDMNGDNTLVMWGDCGVGNFFINNEKLKKCDFSDILYNWDCC